MLYLSQWCPVVKSLQPWHSPVWGWQYSLWPLQWQGRHWGKPQNPGRQWEHWRPEAPGTHSHCPVTSWQKALMEPRRSHSQAGVEENYIIMNIIFIKGSNLSIFLHLSPLNLFVKVFLKIHYTGYKVRMMGEVFSRTYVCSRQGWTGT